MKTPTSPATKQNGRSSLWRERLARHAVSSQTVAAFCRSASISIESFYLWRKRSLTSTDSTGTGDAKSVSAVSPRFMDICPVSELGPKPDTVVPPLARLTIELDLGHGVVLRLLRS